MTLSKSTISTFKARGFGVLRSGEMAPDFELTGLIDGVRAPFRLQEWLLQGCILLAFFPHNWDPATGRQLMEYQQRRPEFLAAGVETVAITVDSIMNSVAWEREIGPFKFPWCADFWPHGKVSQSYGVLREQEPFRGASERALFYISQSGEIEASQVFPLDEPPGVEETLRLFRHVNR